MAEGWTAQGNAALFDPPSLDANSHPAPLPSVNVSPQIKLDRQGEAQALLLLDPSAHKYEELSSNLFS